jgi:hypothetical protein
VLAPGQPRLLPERVVRPRLRVDADQVPTTEGQAIGRDPETVQAQARPGRLLDEQANGDRRPPPARPKTRRRRMLKDNGLNRVTRIMGLLEAAIAVQFLTSAPYSPRDDGARRELAMEEDPGEAFRGSRKSANLRLNRVPPSPGACSRRSFSVRSSAS